MQELHKAFKIIKEQRKEKILSKESRIWLEGWPSLWCQTMEVALISTKERASILIDGSVDGRTCTSFSSADPTHENIKEKNSTKQQFEAHSLEIKMGVALWTQSSLFNLN